MSSLFALECYEAGGGMSLISVAPMINYTDRHERYFLRLISKNVLLYTEMITTAAILHGDRERLLGFNTEEHPLVLQLGGSSSKDLAVCSKMGEDFGYDEINLNVGCPSDRVQAGQFGVCLMRQPELVAECVAAMQAAVSIPVTVKTRIGVDHDDDYEFVHRFINSVSKAGCKTFITHARKAWLKGLSPKQNREVPPLRYEVVQQLKKDFPSLKMILNGGIKTVADIKDHLTWSDGVMIGRAAYHSPYFLADIEQAIFGEVGVPSRKAVLLQFYEYVKDQVERGVRLSTMLRHVLGLYQGVDYGKAFRRYIAEHGCLASAQPTVLLEALRAFPDSL